MKRLPALAGRLAPAALLWAVVLSLFAAFSLSSPRGSDLPQTRTGAALAALQAPEPSATLSAAPKAHRPSDLRLAGEPDPVTPAATRPTSGCVRQSVPACLAGIEPPQADKRGRPQPRAPPLT